MHVVVFLCNANIQYGSLTMCVASALISWHLNSEAKFPRLFQRCVVPPASDSFSKKIYLLIKINILRSNHQFLSPAVIRKGERSKKDAIQ